MRPPGLFFVSFHSFLESVCDIEQKKDDEDTLPLGLAMPRGQSIIFEYVFFSIAM